MKFHKQLSTPIARSGVEESFTEYWLVELDDPKTPVESLLSHRLVPQRFSVHPKSSRFNCIDVQLEQDVTAPNIRSMVVRWSNVVPTNYIVAGKPVYDSNPLRRPLITHYGTYTEQKTVLSAYSLEDDADIYTPPRPMPVPKVPVATTAGEALLLNILQDYSVMHCTKNVAKLPQFMAKVGRLINSDTVKLGGVTYAPKELLVCNKTISPPNFENGMSYYIFSWDMYVAQDEDGWVEKLRNAGYHERQVVYFNSAGQPSPVPVRGGTQKIVLRPIEIGPPENRHYPSAPVLLTPNGRAFRAKNPKDPADIDLYTGEILSTESRTGEGITKKQWDDAVLRFGVYLRIPFKKYIPLI